MKKRVNTYLAIAITTYCNYQCFYCKKGGESISKEKETISFDDVKRELWLQFETKETYEEQINDIWELLKASDGSDEVVLYISSMKAIKRMGAAVTVHIDDTLLSALKEKLSEKNVKVLEKSIEKSSRKGYY